MQHAWEQCQAQALHQGSLGPTPPLLFAGWVALGKSPKPLVASVSSPEGG